MKHLIFKIAVFSMFSFLIMVSETPPYIKIIFMSVMLFFFLPFRYEFFTKERMMRKFLAASIGTLVFTLLILFLPMLLTGDLLAFLDFDEFVQSLGFFAIVFFYTLFGFFIYGLPVSLLSDGLTTKYPQRMLAAGFIHLVFGILLIGELSAIPVICALIFWVIDEILWRRTGKDLVEE